MEEEIPKVADHFPSVRPPCKEVAARFFHCFSTKGEQVNLVVRYAYFFSHRKDLGAGERGLKLCKAEMKLYDDCMKKHYKAPAS